MLVLPHVLDVSVSYQPIHTFAPNNSPEAPFLGIDNSNVDGGKWNEGAATSQINAAHISSTNNLSRLFDKLTDTSNSFNIGENFGL